MPKGSARSPFGRAGIGLTLAQSAPSKMKVGLAKMALLTLGGEYGAAIKNGRQGKSGPEAQGKPRKGPQSKDTAPKSSRQQQDNLTN